MKTLKMVIKCAAILGLTLVAFTGCKSSDGGGSNVSGSVYYGVSTYDPWYYGGYWDDPDIIVTPPPDRPDPPPRPTHPIAPAPAPRPTPMPSIPAMPRPSIRR